MNINSINVSSPTNIKKRLLNIAVMAMFLLGTVFAGLQLQQNNASALPGHDEAIITYTDAETDVIRDTAGASLYNIASGYGTQLSPDGSKVTYIDYGGPGPSDIFVADFDGSNAVNITNTPSVGENRPYWSPDGGTILYDLDGTLYTIEPDGSNQTLIPTPGTTGDAFPGFSPDGTKVLYDYSVGFAYSDLDGTNQVILSQAGQNWERQIWSPDGTKIAFYSSEFNAGIGRDVYTISIIDIDGSNRQDLFSDIDAEEELFGSEGIVWSPDSQKVGYVDINIGFRTVDISDQSLETVFAMADESLEIQQWWSRTATSVTQCDGVDVTIEGTTGDDVLTGTSGVDVIHGLDGDDIIDGLGGGDIICGGEGDDTIRGSGGADTILGEAGQDILLGNGNVDTISGGAGEDIIKGGNGPDVIVGDEGDDILKGNSNDDIIDGSNGADIIKGGSGIDTLSGNGGDDIMKGNAGDDTLDGNGGDNILNGGQDIDTCLNGIVINNCEL